MQAAGRQGPPVFTGSFRLDTERDARGAVRSAVLRGGGDNRIEIWLQRPAHIDLPERMRDITIEEQPGDPSQGRPRVLQVRSAAGAWRIETSGMQVHEFPRLYGRAGFPLGKRLLWSLLLWMARFSWGRSVIQRFAGSRPPGNG